MSPRNHDRRALNLTAYTTFDRIAWSTVFVLLLYGIGWVIASERRRFRAEGKQRSWLHLRLLSVPFLGVTVGAVVLIARSVSGMEALAYFYLAMCTVGPLCWFGLHVVAGRMLSPPLSRAESTSMALLGIGVLVVPALLITMLQDPIFTASRRWTERQFERAVKVGLPHGVEPIRHFRLGTAGEIYAVALLAPAGLQLERVDVLLGPTWQDTATVTHGDVCRNGNDLYLTWPANSTPTPLRLFWRDRDDGRRQSEFRIGPSVAAAVPMREFDVGWRNDGVDLPVPVAREHVQLGWRVGDGRIRYSSLSPQPGEAFRDDCVMRGYHRVAWETEGPIDGVLLTFHARNEALWQYEATRALAGQ